MGKESQLAEQRIWLKAYPAGVPSEIDLSAFQSVLTVFEDAVADYHDQAAFTNMGQTLSFAELDRLSDHFGAYLQQELNLKKGDRIAIQMPNLLQFPVVLFGAMKAGLVIVNTNPLYTPEEMRHQFKDSGAKVVVILANFAANLQKIIHETDIESVIVTEVADHLPLPKRLLINLAVKYVKKMVPSFTLPQAVRYNDVLRLGSHHQLTKTALTLDDTAFLQYTGGTTGVSKGAVLSHRNILANMQQIVEWIRPVLKPGGEVVITALPLYHIFSLTVNCLAFMRYGGQNILVTNPRDIPAFLKLMKETPYTIMTGVNTLFNALMNHPDFQGRLHAKNLKMSVAGAMALQQVVADRWLEKTGTPIFEGYGLTEASPVVCCNPIEGESHVGTIGIPLPSTLVSLRDEDGQEVALGEVGELCVKGPQVMQGYYQRPDETAKVLDGGWLKTGDMAIMLENGFFKIVDRKKDMILVSGFNVYPNEVEDVIARHPAVLEVAVVGFPDGHSGEVVKAFVVKKPGATVTDKEIIEFAKQSLTNYKVPRTVEFKSELPKTNVGKILRRALRS